MALTNSGMILLRNLFKKSQAILISTNYPCTLTCKTIIINTV